MSWPDYLTSGSVDYKFATLAIAGTVAALTGGSVVVYKNNGTVESSAGVSLTADFDSRTGLNHVGINLAADTSFYSAGANFQVILATGTANSVSLNNYPLFHFTVEAQNQKPTGGTVALATAAGTVNNPILVRGGTVGLVNLLATGAIVAQVMDANAIAEIGSGVWTNGTRTLTTPDDPAEAVFKKNTAFSNFEFPMYDTSGDPATGKTVTATRSIDGAAFAACANSVTEVGSGLYKINFAAADMNGDFITFHMSASGCEPTIFSIPTES